MSGDSRFEWDALTRRQLLERIGVGGVFLALPGVFSDVAHAATGAASGGCYATGESCFLGIDPDIYRMPLSGEYIQTSAGRICATTNWSQFPPEAFDFDFVRAVWPSLPVAQQQAVESAAFGIGTTHWGPPDAPPDDLAGVKTPADFPSEVFGSLASRTTRVEFEVPKTDFQKLGWSPDLLPGAAIIPDPAPQLPVKLRGWYIKGDGIAQRKGASAVHALVILSSAFPYSISYDRLVGTMDVGRQMRKTATYLVAQGFDVLFFDKRGHGYSEGLFEAIGEDIFRALDLLEHGVFVEDGAALTLSIITSDGRRLAGATAAAEQLLGAGYTARTKPVVLRGFSYGSSHAQRAMAMNYSDLPVEYRFTRDASGAVVVDETRMPAGNRGYNFRGIIAISGFQGSLKYETAPYFLALEALACTIGHNGAVMKSTVYRSMDRWPGHLGLYATNDYETADGAVDVFNDRLRGFKKIRMVTGYHFGLGSEAVDTYFAEESARFARNVIFEPAPTDNARTTSYAREVCRAEAVVMDPDTESVTSVPSKTVADANRRVDRFIDEWIASHR